VSSVRARSRSRSAGGRCVHAISSAAKLPALLGEELIRAAHVAFTEAMQVTSLVAAVLLVVAGALAWWVIPSQPDGAGDPAERVGAD
jgi:DHA2 family multidrug resistance protein-like MFS transporter